MRLFFVSLILILLSIDLNAKTLYASNFGFSASDASSAFQGAILAEADTIIIDLQTSDWIVGPSKFTSLRNKTIIFQPGVVVKAKPGTFPDNGDCLINLVKAKNLTIIGYGATLQMQKAEYAALDDGEWRHCLAVNNSLDVKVYGLTIKDSGGDGLYVSGDPWNGPQLYSENILFKDIWCDNNYRQGISVISARHLLVQNCWFTNTKGTLPMSGVDLEPDNKSHQLVDVVFENCRFTGNSGNGIQLSFSNLDSNSVPVDITFRQCYVSDNHDIDNPYAAAEIQAGGAVRGDVMFERCMVENSQWTAVFIRKPADAYFINFVDCVFKNVSQNTTESEYNNPIWLEVTDYSNPCPRFGGAAFTNCILEYTSNYDFLNTYGEINTSPGLGKVQLNNLTLIHPNASVTYKTSNGGGSPSSDCLFNYQNLTSPPSTILNFQAEKELVECTGTNSIFEATRISENKSYPLGLTYDVSGTGQQGSDFDLMNGFMIIPADAVSQSDTLKVIQDNVTEYDKYSVLTLVPNSLFSVNSLPQTVSVSDCLTNNQDEFNRDGIFQVFPNPATDIVQINFSDDFFGDIQLINLRGQVVLSRKGQGNANRINTNGLERGIYVLRLRVRERQYNQRLIIL